MTAYDCFWLEPLGSKALAILVHEAGHARNMHHGKGFVEEIERLAGVAASVMFEERAEIIRRWSELVDRNGDFAVVPTESEKSSSLLRTLLGR
jgi:hypothetical protein